MQYREFGMKFNLFFVLFTFLGISLCRNTTSGCNC